MKNTKSETTKFEILISSVNNSRLSVNNYDHVVINQLSDETNIKRNDTNIFNYREKGLSKSRNRALKHATGDICLFSDDDVCFKKNIDRTIIEAFENNPGADIITFQVETPDGGYFRDYDKEKYWHDSISLMKVCSIEIAFRRSIILEKKLRFDEVFGLGSVFQTGAEYIFLTDSLKKGLKILYLPEVIVIHPKENSGKRYNDAELIKSKGAMLYRVFGWKVFLWSFIFSLKQSRLSKYSWLTFFSYVLRGIREYRNHLNFVATNIGI